MFGWNRKEGERKNNKGNKGGLDYTKGILVCVAIVIGLGVYVTEGVIDAKRYKDEKQEKELNLEKEEKSRQPQMSASMGGDIMEGETKYQKIYLKNTNQDITIESGGFGIECLVRGQSENLTINCCLDNVIYQQGVTYLKELEGGILLIREDYQEFAEMAEEGLKSLGVNLEVEVDFKLYLFIYYDFTCDGKNYEGYYKVEIKGERCGAVEEVDDLENFFDAYVIEV